MVEYRGEYQVESQVVLNSKPTHNIKLELKNISLFYNTTKQILNNISIKFYEKKVTALIGPSGCGKSSLLKTINRINDYIDGFRYTGDIILDGKNINNLNITLLRLLVGIVFQKPIPLPGSIYKNVAFGPRIHELCKTKADLDQVVEDSLRKVGLWDEIKDKLHESATSLSGGQQQRLCIARSIAINPRVILMDEPCSALDPIATAKIENLIKDLKNQYTIVIVTHSMSQAQRVSDYTGFLYMGDLVEFDETEKIFTDPKKSLTEQYIRGKMG
jgi:phosphate transport system ATP-binding protein